MQKNDTIFSYSVPSTDRPILFRHKEEKKWYLGYFNVRFVNFHADAGNFELRHIDKWIEVPDEVLNEKRK